MGLVSELRRRNVFRVAIAYVIIAWIILQVGDTLAPALRLDEWVNTALAFFLILGFPIAVFFAWAFELTPEGIKLEQHLDRSQSITHLTGRKLDYVIIAALSIALVYFAFDKIVLDASRDAELVRTTTEAVTEQATETGRAETADRSIAVLAFADLSPEGDQEYFSDGISEELLNVLAKIPGLRVAARTSSFQFKGDKRDIIDIGGQLNVGLVLEGSVRKAGSQLRITAQLVDTENGFHLWSQTYDREFADIFALQDEISAAIVEALKEHLELQFEVVPRVNATASTEAHDAYLRGRHLIAQHSWVTGGVVGRAIREFEKAIEIDSEYALAHAELAIANLLLGTEVGLTDSERLTKAIPHAERAMALDPSLAEAHAAKGFVARTQDRPEEALMHYRRAIQINPNYAVVYAWLGNLLRYEFGRYKEAIAMTEKALRLDPLSKTAIVDYLRVLKETGRHAENDRELDKIASIYPELYADLSSTKMGRGGKWGYVLLSNLNVLLVNPQSPGNQETLAAYFAIIVLESEALAIQDKLSSYVLLLAGRPDDAVTAAEARVADDPESLEARRDLGLALAAAGNYSRARPILEEMWERNPRWVGLNSLVRIRDATALIAVRRDAGDESGAAEVIAAIEDNVRRYREAGYIGGQRFLSVGYNEGLAAYLGGEGQRGLALIAKGVEDGRFIRPNMAYLQVLYDDPGFAPIRAAQEARQARERERVLTVVCNDNPYETVWQPAEGTCEQFAAAGGN